MSPEPADPRLEALPRAFYARPTVDVAHDLLGRYLVRTSPGQEPRVGKLVEVEAYLGEIDRASHAWHGHTRRTAPMFEEPGHAYLYFVYGMYWCINAVTEPAGQACAVLIRGAEPVHGLELSATGPGRLCRAFGLTGNWNRADLTSSDLRITMGEPIGPYEIDVSPRIGVAYAGEWAARPLRFFIRGNPYVTKIPKTRTRSVADRAT